MFKKPVDLTVEKQLSDIKTALDKAAIVAITDRAGKIIHVNDKFCEISKYPREELLGQNHRVINSGHHPREFFVNMWKTISSGQVWAGEVRNRAKDGTFYWVYTTIIPSLDDKGEPYQYVSIRFEITQRKRDEERLIEYSKRLEISNRELQDFASVAAHDLQEPLRKIEAFSDRLKTRFGQQIPDEGRDYLERMTSAAGRMRRLIDDLLTYSRVNTRGAPFVRTDLGEMAREAVDDLEMRIEQTKAKVELGELPTIEADPAQMRQLFLNLIGNALKFHKKDVAPVVKVSSRVTGHQCEISVADNGIGFDEKYLDRIFTIFQRLHGRMEYEGTGVGLAVVRRIADRHEGIVTARSRPDQGATFIVTLPLVQRNRSTE